MVLIQPNMQAHEELAALFSRNLTLDPSQARQAEQILEQQQQQQQAAAEPKIVYSITQHYNHSAHVARPAPQPQVTAPERSASEPPQSERQTVDTILAWHGIDFASLAPSQLQLFKEAGDAQKMRLLELWSIYPVTNSSNNPAKTWSSTSMDQEEKLAQMRQNNRVLSQGSIGDASAMSLDGTPVATTTTTFQGDDGKWLLRNSGNNNNMHSYMEPYMSSGYEELARREYEASAAAATATLAVPDSDEMIYSPLGTAVPAPSYNAATDPVYMMINAPATAVTDWALRQQQAMEDQYGAFSQSCRMEL